MLSARLLAYVTGYGDGTDNPTFGEAPRASSPGYLLTP